MVEAAASCTVRIARSEDLVTILQVLSQQAPDGSGPDSVTSLQRETWSRMMKSGDLTVYLAEVSDRAVGTATMMTMPNLTYGCAPTAFVEAVVVIMSHRRRGVATALMQRLLSDARSAGCNKVQLLSHKRHAADGAHRLYTSLGFEPEAEGFRLYLQEVPVAVRAVKAASH
jgi:GNAT superfamily N-acetyltransferase